MLIAPLGVVARGHNIVIPGSNGRSAIASVSCWCGQCRPPQMQAAPSHT